MNNEATFSYSYSAKENQEVLNIRKKYLPREESKLEELKRLDNLVQNAGVAEALCVGIGGALVFGLGLCFAMGALSKILWLGVLLGLLGMAGMLAAFPVYRKFFEKAKTQYAPHILELSAELTGNNG